MDNFSTLINLKDEGPEKEEVQNFNKLLSSIRKDINKTPFFHDCQICKKANIKFCNSHTIPRFILKNIENNGRLYNTQILKTNPLCQQENGIENIQTFKNICIECDSKIFQEYENPENWLKTPNDIMLSQIALKTQLYYQWKLTRDIKFLEYINKNIYEASGIKERKSPIYGLYEPWKIDKKYHTREVQRIYNNINKGDYIFKIGYFKKLSYTIPIVFQGTFVIYFDLHDRLLNNPLCSKIDGLDYIYICLYPFQDSSIVLVFYKKNNTKYNMFFRELNELELEEQLSILNFLIFLYSEDIFISKNIDNNIFQDMNLLNVAFIQPITETTKSNTKTMQKARLAAFKRGFTIKNHNKCANLLNKDFSI